MDKQFHWGSEMNDGAVSPAGSYAAAVTTTTLVLLPASRNKQAYLFSFFFPSNLSMPLPVIPFKS